MHMDWFWYLREKCYTHQEKPSPEHTDLEKSQQQVELILWMDVYKYQSQGPTSTPINFKGQSVGSSWTCNNRFIFTFNKDMCSGSSFDQMIQIVVCWVQILVLDRISATWVFKHYFIENYKFYL